MATQREQALTLAELHVKGDPLIIFNIWDAGSAQAVQEIGAKVIATGSWGAAAAQGYGDGQQLPLDLALTNLKRITAVANVPVTFDVEGGYAVRPAELKETVRQVIEAGAVGINFEDQMVDGEALYSADEQSERISAVREAAEEAGIPLFINARTDIFLKLAHTEHREQQVEEALRRSEAYAAAGASGLFAPGLSDPAFIETICARSPLPVNILALAHTPTTKELAQLGVARVSYGGGPYRQALAAFKEAGRSALEWQ